MIEQIYQDFFNIRDYLSQDSRNSKIKFAISSWYNQFSLEDETKNIAQCLVFDLIDQWSKKNQVDNQIINYLHPIIMNVIKSTIKTISLTLKQESPNIEQHSNNEYTKFIVLIGFIGAGLGLVLYLLYKKQSQKRSIASTTSVITQKQVLPEVSKKNLVIVINYKKNRELIKTLKSSGITSKEQGELLYLATQFLWLGSKGNFDLSDFKQYFSQEEITEISEYDVVLVHIKLTESDPGFEPNAINRLPAFKRLHEITKPDGIQVSQRLSSQAYNNSNLYKN